MRFTSSTSSCLNLGCTAIIASAVARKAGTGEQRKRLSAPVQEQWYSSGVVLTDVSARENVVQPREPAVLCQKMSIKPQVIFARAIRPSISHGSNWIVVAHLDLAALGETWFCAGSGSSARLRIFSNATARGVARKWWEIGWRRNGEQHSNIRDRMLSITITWCGHYRSDAQLEGDWTVPAVILSVSLPPPPSALLTRSHSSLYIDVDRGGGSRRRSTVFLYGLVRSWAREVEYGKC